MSPAVWRLRPASSADLEVILTLQQACAEAPHWSRTAWLAALAPHHATTPTRAAFLAETPHALIGFAVALCAGTVAELETVTVSVPARRQGIGKALCLQVIEWSRKSGAHTLELEVRASSQGARALYRSLGFVEQGTRPAYYRDPSEDAVLMAAPL